MLRGAKILLVDHHTAARERTAAALRDAGATVNEAASAQVALLLLQTDPVDIILSEIALPDADGYALIQTIRRLPEGRTASIPAVAMSDEASDADRQRALFAGFQLHILRPADAKGLALTLAGVRRLSMAAHH